jgi:hypothetical protein
LVALLAATGCGSSSSSTKTNPVRAPARGVSEQQLSRLAGTVGHAIYWAGPQSGKRYELSRTKDGRIFVRYLPKDVNVGDPQPKYLAVGTYPQSNAFSVLKATAKKQHASLIALRDGGKAFVDAKHPTSVYLAYPGSNYQIEVFDPSAAHARALVVSGKILPVGIAAAGRAPARAASVSKLRAVAAQVGHAVYWAGARAGITYELTQTSDGRIYIRYLPQGVKIGDPRADYLTVGTYPQTNGVAALKSLAAKAKAQTIPLAGGAVAWIAKSKTSVYVARSGEDLLVEVFDPSPARARQLVTSGRIKAVG